jgi:hypothetical protein
LIKESLQEYDAKKAQQGKNDTLPTIRSGVAHTTLGKWLIPSLMAEVITTVAKQSSENAEKAATAPLERASKSVETTFKRCSI